MKKILTRFTLTLMLIVVSVNYIPAEAVAEGISEHPTNNWTRQSPYSAISKPEIKWTVNLEDDVEKIVIDSKGVIYALINSYPTATLTAINPNGTVKWSEVLKASEGSGLALFADKYLIVAGNLGKSYTTGISDEDPNKVYIDNPDALISKYTTDGVLLWENEYKETTLGLFSGELAVDTDGFIAFTGEFGSIIQNYKHVSDPISSRLDIKLIGITASGETKFNLTIATTTKEEPMTYSAPTFVKGNLYLTTSKGHFQKISKSASIGVFDKGTLTGVTKDGTKKFSTVYNGYNSATPVYTNNTMYVIGDNKIYMYDLSGKIKKTIDAKNGVNNWIGPSISEQGYLVFGQKVFSPSGKYMWGFNPYASPPTSNLASVNTVVIDKKQNIIMAYMEGVYSQKTGIIAMDLKSGKTKWQIPLYHSLNTPPIIGKDGTIYVAGTKLFAIGQR